MRAIRAARLDLAQPAPPEVEPLESRAELRELARRPSTRLAIRVKSRILFIESADVIAVLAQGNYVLLERTESSHLLRESISVVAEKLAPYGFIRIHRSMLVNISLVEELQPWQTGQYRLRMKNGREYTVTRTYKKNLNALAESWIGTGELLSRSRM